MDYISTRNSKAKGVSSAIAIKDGLAPDGGLYMPRLIPSLTNTELDSLIEMSYPERAAFIIGKFLTDYTPDELLSDAKAAYSEDKFIPSPAPVTTLGNGEYMLELWHGPTCAFKDMALQIMPRLFVRALRKCNEDKTAMILVATSGDTGKAALEGYRDVEGTKVKVFYPVDGVSRIQKLQMQTQEGNNVSVDGIVGNFDDAQSGVKKIFADSEVKRQLESEGVFLSSANSINWGRLVPQIVYYVSAWCDLITSGELRRGELLDISVPTGNFGNIFACYIAKRMGMPFGKLICASNRNNVLTDFLSTGVYDRNRSFYTTTSPSMDILISSNLERLLFLTLGDDRCRHYMNSLSSTGSYRLSPDELALIQRDFVGYYADDDETSDTIKATYKEKNCLIDTHTAVAVNAMKCFVRDNKAERKILAVSTASPYKFAKDVYHSLTGLNSVGEYEALAALTTLTGVSIPYPLRGLGDKTIKHTRVIDKSDMEAATLDFARN